MTETYLGVLGQKYERHVYCRCRLGTTELLSHENRYNEDDMPIV